MSKNDVNSRKKETDGDLKIFRKRSVAEVVNVPTTCEQEPLNNINGSVQDFEKLDSENIMSSGRSSVFLFVSVFIVSLLSFSCGIGMSWTSPVIPKLNSTESPLNSPIDTLQISWIVAIMSIGQIVGPFFYGYLADHVGRKRSLIFCSIPIIVGLITLAFARDVKLYYVARFLHGFGIGGLYAVSSNYIAEISMPHNRGLLAMISYMFASLGATSSYAIGPFLSIKLFCLVSVVPAILFLVLFSIFVPDSPMFLIMNNREQDAVNALQKLRSSSEKEIENEVLKIKEFVAASHSGKSVGMSYLVKHCRKAFTISIVLSLAPPLSGVIVMLSFLQIIFEHAGNSIDPKSASIVIGIIKFLTMFVTSAIIEKVGRKTLLFGTCVGLSASNLLLGLFFFVKLSYPELSVYIWWIPLACLSSFFICFNLGIGSVNMVYQSEIFPSSVRSLAAAFSITLAFSLGFIIAFIFPVVSKYFGFYFPFCLFSGFSALISIFIYFYLPETKGKSLAEIQEIFKSS